MIPGKIIRFLEERASIAFAGTRDGNLVYLAGTGFPDGKSTPPAVPSRPSSRHPRQTAFSRH